MSTTYSYFFASTVVLAVVTAQYYNAGSMTGIGCVITGDKLFSHGNYIRDLKEDEVKDLNKYREELTVFQKAIGEAYAQADIYNGTAAVLPTLPPRPTIPSFCTGNETTLYVLGSCTVQNHKVYVSGKFARELNDDEKDKLYEFNKKLAENQAYVAEAENETNSTMTETPVAPPEVPTLDFCTEF
ncbi:unnamed protein product [Bursaphelenchus okinawaensis]|uniref:Pepsin inhibitor-3-like repeated domain-containing protein n=1 Tax=Bursaphelenchus okinawaensis TaxID=465554 RepID=A0A811K8L9_9BILA|nr:unnamed protein product [Bursaphelenchus okinawaensis]CAG9094014.1 unnamed protein product [Bursaphelenchus okinawaensis]